MKNKPVNMLSLTSPLLRLWFPDQIVGTYIVFEKAPYDIVKKYHFIIEETRQKCISFLIILNS